MKREIEAYFPENIQPEEFMRPPTEAFKEQVVDNCREIGGLISEELENYAFTGKRRRSIKESPVPDRGKIPVLRVGAEIELLLFSPKSNPREDRYVPAPFNPNYKPVHEANVIDFCQNITKPPEQGGLGDVLLGDVEMKRIFTEIRTFPLDVEEYLEAMDRIGVWIRETCKGEINPLAYSQHLHISLNSANEKANLLKAERQPRSPIVKGVVDIYRRTPPLITVPEDFLGRVNIGPIQDDYSGVLTKDPEYDDDVKCSRIECRLNNHNYAFDPYINLMVHLLGVYRGLMIDKYQLKRRSGKLLVPYSRPSFTFGWRSSGPLTYEDGLEGFVDDEILNSFLPSDLLKKLDAIYQYYPDITEGTVVLSKIREMGHALMKEEEKPQSQLISVFS